MKPILGAIGLVVGGLVVFEIVMQPSRADRLGIALIFALMAAIAGSAAILLPRFASSTRSLRRTVTIVSTVSFVVVAIGLVVAGREMFISQHDLRLLLTVVGFGAATSLAFAVSVGGPLTDDLRRISRTASAISNGEFETGTSVVRGDEVGELARAVDAMADSLRLAREERQRSEAARREFFSSVGHDLRSPLASLRAALEAVQDGLADDVDRYLASMESDLETLSRLVEDLFLLARIDSGDIPGPAQVDLNELVDEAIEVFMPIAARKDVILRLDAKARVVATASPEAIARVVRNLLDNAIRYSPHGGEVVVSVENGNDALVTVTDQGAGFSQEFATRAFERFSRDDRARNRSDGGGAGLGLAIASGYVMAAGGAINAVPGPGGTVRFRLPLGGASEIEAGQSSTQRQ